MPAFIPDGYTISAKLNAIPEISSDVISFQYRPATGGETNAWLFDRARGDGKQLSEANAAFISSHLVKWSIAHDQKTIDITPENCSRLHHTIINRLCDIIAGYDTPDVTEGEEPTQEAVAVKN